MDVQIVKEQICEICRRMWQLGWAAANDGNLSVKWKENAYFVTPSGVSKGLITPEMLLTVNGEGEVLEGGKDLRPSSELKMHLCCYKEREDAGAVVHAHPPYGTAFAAAGIPLDSYSLIETILTLGAVPVTPYATPSTEEVPASIIPYLKDHDALLLKNHGALTVGSDLMTAYYRMESLEHFARISLYTRLLGGPQELSAEQAKQLISMRPAYGITGRHPGYHRSDD